MRLELTNLQLLAPLSDEEIATRVVEGDTGAFELLMRRHNQRLFRTARAILSNDEDAQDALQEAYIRIYSGLSKFEDRSKLVTWMTRIVFNESIRFRTRRASIRGRERHSIPPAMLGHDNQLQDHLMNTTERMQMFDEAMAVLTSRERSVVMLRLIHGLSTRETAESLGMSESNVKISLFRAKPKMAMAFDEPGIDQIRQQLSFDGDRCDRLVAAVFQRLEAQINL